MSQPTWSNGEFAFQRTLHVSDRWRMHFDVKLAEALLALPVAAPMLEAIREFNAANTGSGDVAPHVEVVTVKSALEWLLGIDERRSSLSAALTRFLASQARRHAVEHALGAEDVELAGARIDLLEVGGAPRRNGFGQVRSASQARPQRALSRRTVSATQIMYGTLALPVRQLLRATGGALAGGHRCLQCPLSAWAIGCAP